MRELIRKFVTSEGVQLFGVASAQAYAERLPDKAPPSRFLEGARSIVVMGMPYLPTTISTVIRSKELLPFYEDPEDMDDPTPHRNKGGGSDYFSHTGIPEHFRDDRLSNLRGLADSQQCYRDYRSFFACIAWFESAIAPRYRISDYSNAV